MLIFSAIRYTRQTFYRAFSRFICHSQWFIKGLYSGILRSDIPPPNRYSPSSNNWMV